MVPARRNCLDCTASKTDCFCSLTNEALLELRSAGRNLHFDEGERLLHEGHTSESVYVICSGRAKLTASSPDGRLLIVRLAGPGDLLGLAAALKDRHQNISAEALEPCEVKSIERNEFLRFMEHFNDAGRNAVVSVALEYENALLSARRLALSSSAAGKLASVLLDWGRMGHIAGDKAMEFRMPLTHEELGSMAGISRETVTRLLAKFRSERLVEQKGEQMILLSPNGLEALCS
ncbi:MAG TPA: Crp/Fnr family transcriptional regulator [Edaphobacter sp.]